MAFQTTSDPVLKPHVERILDLATTRRNYSTTDAVKAAENLRDGKGAYWFRGQFSAASFVATDANFNGSLIRALVTFADQHKRVSLAEDVLDNIIPLNQAAIDEMQLAYRLQSTFRDDLDTRERDAIFDPYFMPGLSLKSRREWAEEYEAVQARFSERAAENLNARPVTSPAAALAIAATNIPA